MKAVAWICLTILLLVLGAVLAPKGAAGLEFLTGPRSEDAAAAYALSHRTTADYVREIDSAIAAGDADLAESLFALANRQGTTLPPGTDARVEAAADAAAARLAEDAWAGFLSGEAPNEAALAGALASDLTGIGDIRDLYLQAERYVNGEAVDPLITGLAVGGLGITAVTISSAGLALPARTGLTTLKAVKRAGRLSPALAREAGTLVSRAVAGRGLKASAAALETLGTDIATIGSRAGYRATLQTLETAQSTAELSRMARLSKSFGKATRAAMVMGGTAFSIASLTATAAMWTVSWLLWAVAAALAATRLSFRIGRWLWRASRRDLEGKARHAVA